MKRIAISLLALLYIIPSFSQTMEWHIKDKYADVCYMGNNLFKVKKPNGKWGIINGYGEISVEEKYDSITPFVENRALILDKTGIHIKGIVNTEGNIIKTFKNNERVGNYKSYNEGMLAYGIPNGQFYLFGYLDINGDNCINPQFYWASPFNDGKAVIQRKTGYYSLINKKGDNQVNSNQNLIYMSSPVNNRLFIATASSRGEKVVLAELEQSGKLKEVEVLEKSTKVTPSKDYKSVSCKNNGHIYYFDDAMRLISSSTGRKFNTPLAPNIDVPKSDDLKKMREHGGWKILHLGKTLTFCSFKDIKFCGDEYAIVTSQQNTMGVLKFNKNGNITIQNVPDMVELYHNAAVKENLAINGQSRIVPTVGDAAEYAGKPEKYDLVCANILGHLLIAFSGNISTWVKDGKYLALAGILNSDFDAVSRCYCEKGFEEIERFTLREWTSGLFRKIK